MAEDGVDIGAPKTEPGSDRNALSVHGRMLMGSLQSSLFGASEVTRMGRYHLLETLGRGAMGVVYKAYDPQLDRCVAVKVVTLSGADARARMLREAKALAKLNHPNVVTVHEVSDEGDEMYVAMEYVEGGTLADWCAAHPESSPERTRALIDFALQALEGLAAAHDLGLVHRDLKPANMLVGVDGRLRIADFGLARTFEAAPELLTSSEVEREGESSTSITSTGAVVGTPAFMAVEQFKGHADALSDQFGLCATFFVAFYGCRPYEASSVAGLVEALEGGRVASPSAKHVPEYVRNVLLRGLQARSEDRYKDARAMSRALRAGANRRRWALGTGMASAGAAAIATVVWASQPDPCTEERSRIEAALDGEADRIADLLEASGRPHPGELADRFSAELEGIADHWSTQTLEACRASRDPDPEIALAGDHRTRCLEDALETTKRTLGELTSFTPEQADALPMVAYFIQGVCDCRVVDRETFDTDFGRTILATYRDGLLAEERLQTSEAKDAFQSVLDATTPGQLSEVRAQAHLRLSSIADSRGDDHALKRHLVASLGEAARGDNAGLEALAWISAAKAVPLTDSDVAFELLLDRSHQARAWGPLSDEMRAELLFEEAYSRWLRGQFERVRELLEEALPIGEASDAPVLPFIYKLYAAVLQRTGDLEQAEARAEDAVESLARQRGTHHPDVARLQQILANIQSWRGRDEQALETYGRTIATLQERPDEMAESLFGGYVGRGDSLALLLRYPEALADYERAAELAKSIGERGESLLSRVYVSRARIYWAQKRHEAALADLEIATRIDPAGDVQALQIRAAGLILQAQILANLDRDREALDVLEHAAPAIEAGYGTEGIPRVQAAFEIADVYTNAGEHERAQAEIERFLPETKGDPMWRSILEQARARDYRAQGRNADALDWAQRALASMQASGAGDSELDVIHALIAMLDGPETSSRYPPGD
ncbi:MAG: protein kinase domain-containing protein [Nannocystales bacterium]